MVLGLVIALGDLRLTPTIDSDGGVGYAGAEVFLIVALGLAAFLAIALAALGRWGRKALVVGLAVALAATLVAVLVAAAVLPWVYNSYDVPAERYMVLPLAGVGMAIIGAVAWTLDRRPHAEILMMAALTVLALLTYVQETTLVWAAAAGLAATLLWLVPSVSLFARIAGLGLHFLALLGFLQGWPQWFTWTPFPFLTFAPPTIIAQFLRTDGTARQITWWTGAVVSVGTAALGVSTSVGNLRRGLSVVEPLAMLAGGLLFCGVFLWFWRGGAGPHPGRAAAPA